MRAYLLGLLLAVLCLFCAGCASSMCETMFPKACGKTTPEPIFVTDYEKPTKLPVPEEPDWNLLGMTDSAEWREWLEAQALDLGMCLDWSAELQHVIESYNESVDSMPENSPDP